LADLEPGLIHKISSLNSSFFLCQPNGANVCIHFSLQFDFYLIGFLGPCMQKLIENRIFVLIPF